MGKPHRIAHDVKEQILKRIKEDGIPVSQVASEHGIHETTIYGWIAKGVSSMPTLRELSHLRKKNKMLMELVGELTVKLSHAPLQILAEFNAERRSREATFPIHTMWLQLMNKIRTELD